VLGLLNGHGRKTVGVEPFVTEYDRRIALCDVETTVCLSIHDATVEVL